MCRIGILIPGAAMLSSHSDRSLKGEFNTDCEPSTQCNDRSYLAWRGCVTPLSVFPSNSRVRWRHSIAARMALRPRWNSMCCQGLISTKRHRRAVKRGRLTKVWYLDWFKPSPSPPKAIMLVQNWRYSSHFNVLSQASSCFCTICYCIIVLLKAGAAGSCSSAV